MNLLKLLAFIFLSAVCTTASAQIGTEIYKLDSVEYSTYSNKYKTSTVYHYVSNYYGQFEEYYQTVIDAAGNRNTIQKYTYTYSDTSYIWKEQLVQLFNPATQMWQNSQKYTRDYQNGKLSVLKQYSWDFALNIWTLSQEWQYSYDGLGRLVLKKAMNTFMPTPPTISETEYTYKFGTLDSVNLYSTATGKRIFFTSEVHWANSSGVDTLIINYRYVDSLKSLVPIYKNVFTLDGQGEWGKMYYYTYSAALQSWGDTLSMRVYKHHSTITRSEVIFPEAWSDAIPGNHLTMNYLNWESVNGDLVPKDKYVFAYSAPVPRPNGIAVSNEAAFSVYPNPSHHHYFIQMNEPDEQITWILRAGNGQVILDGKGKEVDASSLSPGVYFLEVKGNQAYGTQRVIKLP